ncbi:30S ribosome-binding factor RbfA [Candidatus Omnitrophota bacterium]
MGRNIRIAAAIKKEVGSIVQYEIKDPRLGFVTITGCDVSPDLRQAKVFFSVLGDSKAHKDTRKALESALGFIRRLIGQRIRMRFTPQIHFREDKSSEYSIRIQEVLNELKEKDESK